MKEQKTQTCFTLAELQQVIRQSPDQLTLIDVRNPEEYAFQRIPGAINIPLNELESWSGALSKQALIITACGKGGGRSAQGATLLAQSGFSKVKHLCGGTFGWFESQAV